MSLTLEAVGLILVLLGFLLLFVAILLEIASAFLREEKEEKKEVKAAGVIFIGPIPIVVGTDVNTVKLALAIAALMILMLIAMVLLAR